MTPLLNLAWLYLDNLPSEAFQGQNNYLDDLLEMVVRLLSDRHQDQVALMFVPDYETLKRELAEVPEGQEWPVLDEHLGQLETNLKVAKSDEDAVGLALENLFCSLQHLYEGFGPQA